MRERPSSTDLELLPIHEVPQYGLSPAERMRLLSQGVRGPIPSRNIAQSEQDNFGLLEHKDTYEVLAGTIFDECEGIYKQLAQVRPEVRKQFDKQAKSDRQRIELPVSELGTLYSFRLVRERDACNTTHLFQRADRGYENSGFRVIRDENGSILLKNLNPDETDTRDDAEYYKMLVQAHRWVQDYAASLNLRPNELLRYAQSELQPRTPASVAKNGLKNIFLKRGRGGRLTLRPVAALLCASVTAGTAGVMIPLGFANGGSRPHKARHVESAAQRRIDRFDAFHLQLPANAAVRVGGSAPVAYAPALAPLIEQQAPNYGKQASIGTVRHVPDISQVYPGGFTGLEAHTCAPEVPMDLGQTAVRIVNTDALTGNDLQASLSNRGLAICNTSNQDFETGSLDGIYIEPVR